MTAAIKRYPVRLDDLDGEGLTQIDLPFDSQILYAVGEQDEIALYALVETDSEDAPFDVWVKATGENADNLPTFLTPLGVVELRGALVQYHVFASMEIEELEEGIVFE